MPLYYIEEDVEKKKLKIVMLGHKHIPSREGGIEVVVEELGVRMARRGNQVTCLNRKGHHVSGRQFDQKKLSEYQGIQIRYLPTIQKKGLAAVSSSFFGAVRAAFGSYDIVHFHAEGPCAFLWIAKLFGKRCVATIHGLDWKREKWQGSFGKKYIHFGERIAAKYADEIIVLSKDVQKYFQSEYARETLLIPNGVNSPHLVDAKEIKAKWNLDQESYLLFLGRVVPEKGLKYLVDAYQMLNTSKKLVIAGGTSDTAAFGQMLKESAQGNPNIIFTDFVEGRVLEELYSNAYLYCLPSDLEGMPLSLLEAMSYGNCCVVSDIPECVDVVEDKAVVFPKGNTEKLAEVLQSLCDHPEIVSKYKASSSSFILNKYSWEKVVDMTLKCYRSVE